MKKIRILIADDIEETRNVIKKLLSLEEEQFEVVGEASNGEEVLKVIPKVRPDVVLMDINMPVLNGLEATERITEEFPGVIVIIMSVQGENEYLKKAMFYGAKEYIIKPFTYEVLIETISSTYEKHKTREARFQQAQEVSRNTKTVAFFSSKGGVGKSVLALNTSIMMSKNKDKKILLVDLDLLFGDISMLINKFNQKTILDAVDDGQIDEYEKIKPYLYNYNDNLDILFAPHKPEAAEYIGKDSIDKIFKTFQNQYDEIIFDLGVNFNDNTLYVLDNANTILFVSTTEIVALKNTKLGLNVMQSLGYDKNKVKLVINRFTSNYGITKAEVEEAFKDKIFALIPDEEKPIALSVNKGEPFCDGSRNNRLKSYKAIEDLCQNLLRRE